MAAAAEEEALRALALWRLRELPGGEGGERGAGCRGQPGCGCVRAGAAPVAF